jgi:hypothetical protein
MFVSYGQQSFVIINDGWIFMLDGDSFDLLIFDHGRINFPYVTQFIGIRISLLFYKLISEGITQDYIGDQSAKD